MNHLHLIRFGELVALVAKSFAQIMLLMVQKSYTSVEVGSVSHYLQGFIHPKWCRISSINSRFDYFLYIFVHF